MSSSSTKNKSLLFIIAVLLLTNIAVLVYFLMIKKEHAETGRGDRKNGLTDMLQKEVGFNNDQIAQYKILKEEQWNTIRPMFDDMRKAKDSLFKLLSNPSVNDSIIDKTSDQIAKKQKALDLQTFTHFKKVRALCTNAEQQVKYDSMIQRMFRKMGRANRRTETTKEGTKK